MWEFFFLSLFLLSLQFFLSFFSIFLSYILSGSLYVFLLSIFSFLYNLFFLSFFLFHSLYVFLSFLFTMCLFLVEKNCPSETFLQLEHGGNKNDVWHGLSKCLNMWEQKTKLITTFSIEIAKEQHESGNYIYWKAFAEWRIILLLQDHVNDFPRNIVQL